MGEWFPRRNFERLGFPTGACPTAYVAEEFEADPGPPTGPIACPDTVITL
jgi:hypothetical protein